MFSGRLSCLPLFTKNRSKFLLVPQAINFLNKECTSTFISHTYVFVILCVECVSSHVYWPLCDVCLFLRMPANMLQTKFPIGTNKALTNYLSKNYVDPHPSSGSTSRFMFVVLRESVSTFNDCNEIWHRYPSSSQDELKQP